MEATGTITQSSAVRHASRIVGGRISQSITATSGIIVWCTTSTHGMSPPRSASPSNVSNTIPTKAI